MLSCFMSCPWRGVSGRGSEVSCWTGWTEAVFWLHCWCRPGAAGGKICSSVFHADVHSDMKSLSVDSHSGRTSSRWSRRRRAKRWSCWCITHRATAAGKCSSLRTEPGAEREGTHLQSIHSEYSSDAVHCTLKRAHHAIIMVDSISVLFSSIEILL